MLLIGAIKCISRGGLVIKPKLARPGRVPVTTCVWDCDGKSVARGIGDDSIQIWSIKPGRENRPEIYVAND
ncbi:hypothetical protein Hanom_Chr00s121333g01811791 [Helianthus anomalus]